MSKFSISITLLILTLIFVPIVDAQLADSPWPMYHRDTRHTAQSPNFGPQNPYLKWVFKAELGITSSPVISKDGTIYIGSWDGYLYALNPDGKLKWRFFTEDRISSTPAINFDGTIYIDSKDGYLYSITPDGTLKWKFFFGVSEYVYFPGPTIANDGTIYICSETLYAVNPDGTQKWRYQDPLYNNPFAFSSAVLGQDGTIYMNSYRDLHAIDPSGNPIWQFPFSEGFYALSSLSIGNDGAIYTGSENQLLLSVNNDGTERWRFNPESSFVLPPIIGTDGTIYVASEDNYLYALNPDGSLKWKFKTDRLIRSSPAIDADGVIYVNSWDKYLYAINPDGTMKWKFRTALGIVSAPAIDKDGTIYFANYEGYIFAVGDTRKMSLDLYTRPEKYRFSDGDELNLKLDMNTYSKSLTADIFFVLMNNTSMDIYYAFTWGTNQVPTASGVFIPDDFSIKGSSLLDLQFPSINPPINSPGAYTFAIAAFDSSTGQLLSNIAKQEIMYVVR
jgi:outer membrane protein assembly factor BamB